MELRYGGMRFQLCSWTLAFHSMQTHDLATQGVDFFRSSSEIQSADRRVHQVLHLSWLQTHSIQWKGKSLMSLFASKRRFPQSGVMSQEIILVFGQEIFISLLKLHLKRLNHHPCPTARQGKCQLWDYRQQWAGSGVCWLLLDLPWEGSVETTVIAKTSC